MIQVTTRVVILLAFCALQTTSQQIGALNAVTTVPIKNETTNLQLTNNKTTEQISSLENISAADPLSQSASEPGGLQAEESQQAAVAISVAGPTANAENPRKQPSGAYLTIARDGSNRYEFGYDTATGSQDKKTQRGEPRLMREESRLEDGTVIGRYGYTDPFNVFRIVQYVAGADGYFATEDVGAPVASPGSQGTKLQLNKQLHKALELARAKRLAKSRQARDSLAPDSASSEEPLSGSGSDQTVRFATKINHVVGSNGLTYATAFRPKPVERVAERMATSAAIAPLQYEPVRSPDPMVRIQQQEELRSKLPAPIYTGGSNTGGSFSFVVEHSADMQDPLEAPAGESPWIPAAPAPRLPAPGAVQASQAWTLVNNNYNQLLLIDHDAKESTVGQSASAAATQRFNENFDREAAMLSSLRKQKSQPTPSPHFGTAYNYNQQTLVPNADSGLQFGARAGSSSPSVVNSEYSFAGSLALKQFDPPLYHPEVHETRPAHANYASTQVRSELAAAHDYLPQRLRRQPELESLNTSSVNDGQQAVPAPPPPFVAVEPLIKYATRLRPIASAWTRSDLLGSSLDEELETDNSEQVAYVSATSANGTSRAKLPDRSKKLSSIFKARNVGSPGASEEHSIAKIRRPIPVNVKAQFGLTSNKPGAVTTINLTPAVFESFEKQASSVSSMGDERVLSTAASNKFEASKKFGKLANGLDNKLISLANSETIKSDGQELFEVPAAKRRPQLRFETKVLVDQANTSTSTTSATTSTSTTIAPTTTQSLIKQQDVPVITTTNTTPVQNPNREDLPTATIIDAFHQSNDEMRSTLDKDLYEKIVKIQREIAAKAQIAPGQRGEPTITTQNPIVTTAAATQSTTTELPSSQRPVTTTTIAPPSTTTLEIRTTTAPERTVTSASTTNAPTTPTVAQSTTTEGSPMVERLLTGPLAPMESSNAEFMDKMALDSFDIVRAVEVPTTTTTGKPISERSITESPPTAAPKSFSTTTTTTTASPVSEITTTNTMSSSSQAPTTTTTTTTSTVRPIVEETTRRQEPVGVRSKSKKVTSSPRFGRLVIKRGNKVVANFNASEPIPDSMIPIDNNGTEIILADLPRVARRRTVIKKKMGGFGAKSNKQLISKHQLEPRDDLNVTVTAASSSSPTVAPIVLRRNSSQLESGPDTNEASGSSRSLVRGPRSYEHQEAVGRARDIRLNSRNWSARLSSRASGRQNRAAEAPAKVYDAKEDLEKIVEKIVMAQEGKLPKSRNLSRGVRQQPMSTTTGSPILITSQQPTFVPTTDKSASTILPNATSTSILVSSTKFEFETQNSTSSFGNFSASVNSSLFQVTDQRAENTTDTRNLPRTPPQLVESTTQPLNGSINLAPSKDSYGTHGDIQVRNNQSSSVHVDIDPIGHKSAQGSSEKPSVPARRLIGRDTMMVAASFGSKDIHRLEKSPRTEAQVTTSLSGAARKPRMLCIEVDSVST